MSRAEFSVAKSGYIKSNSGWISDRSICYLASGRPVLAQDVLEEKFRNGELDQKTYERYRQELSMRLRKE
mgnify:CR=1 FL=1